MRIKIIFCAVFFPLFSSVAMGQAYPAKPIRLISPWAPGGPAEALARTVTMKMSEALGQPIIIESKGGANGTIGTAFVAKAAPDGYTLLLSHLGPTAISPALQKDMPYDSIKDFEPISQVVSGPTLLVVRNDLPVKSVAELLAHAKANPGKLSYGSVGIGSTTHLAGEMLNMTAGIDTLHVPYKGSTPILVDLMGGRIAFAFIGISGSLQQARAGQIRAIAISTLQRSASAPDIPAVAETLPGFELNSWYGMMAPAGTPKAIVTRLNQELGKALRLADVIEWMKQNGLDPRGTTPEEHGAYIRSEIAKWAKIVRDAKVTVN
ncbi:MAG: tripartite tricarboxylate transporter substrate binding protein [Betaproteobacteria bacterium]|nr:tripartite tricarboxylate transporter substrate binding protein [Betaproteobacteria bacterium]